MTNLIWRMLITLCCALIAAIPFGIAVAPFIVLQSNLPRLMYCFLAPVVYGVSYLLFCGLLSCPFRHGIQEGKFTRSMDDPVYRVRRIHALCWTAIYYSPGYSFFLTSPLLKSLLFRLFGYQGSLDFTCYPDTWIRDLPILNIGSGAYLSNKSTIGTNLALTDGRIMVEGIRIGAGAMLGHLAMIAAGTSLGDGAELSHGTASGARVFLGKNAVVNPDCGIDHRSEIGDNAQIGTRSYLGLGAVIGNGVKVPAGSVIPRRSRILTQADMDRMRALETRELIELRQELADRLRRFTDGAGEAVDG